jgi:hypothetical protein
LSTRALPEAKRVRGLRVVIAAELLVEALERRRDRLARAPHAAAEARQEVATQRLGQAADHGLHVLWALAALEEVEQPRTSSARNG